MSPSHVGLARAQQFNQTADFLALRSHFTSEECKSLLRIHEAFTDKGKFDRLRFRDFLSSSLEITEELMLDLMFKVFDRNNDGQIDDHEFVFALSHILRGDLHEQTEACYFIYDMNGDKSLAREELYQCLKGSIIPGYGVDADEIEDAERDIVELVMRKLDVDKDGQIIPEDFENAVAIDSLLLQACGPCIPSQKATAAFLSVITENYRGFSGCYSYSRAATNTKSARTRSIHSSLYESRAGTRSRISARRMLSTA